MSKVLVFSKINRSNFLLCYVLSFFWKVRTFQYENARVRKILKRTSLYDWGHYCELDEGTKYFFNNCVKKWINNVNFIDNNKIFFTTIDDVKINVSKKIKKDLCPEFSHYSMFQKFKHKNEYYIQGILSYYLAKYTDYSIDKEHNFLVRVLSYINIFMEHLWHQLYNLLKQMYFMNRSIKIILFSKKLAKQNIKIIWEAVSGPHELSCDSTGSNCFWILENTNLTKDEIIFILPWISDSKYSYHLKDSQISYVHYHVDLIKYLHLKQQLYVAIFNMKIILNMAMGFFNISLKNQINANKLSLIIWKYLVPHLGIKTYVNSVSHSLLSSYDVLMLNNISVNTVLYHYSANNYPKSLKEKIITFHMSYSTILHRYVTVWNKYSAKDIHTTYDSNITIKVTGPLLTSKEKYNNHEIGAFRSKLLSYNKQKKYLITVFDIAPQKTKSGTSLVSSVEAAITEQYYTEFIRDIDRLMNEISDVVILYKPKRSFTEGNLSAPYAYDEITNKNKNNPRWVTLDNKTNTWLLVLISDLVISIPFTSSSLVALNKKKPFLYHNPSQYFTNSYYEDLDDYITKSYQELIDKVRSVKKHGMDINEFKKTSFYVAEPKGGYSQGFVDFLRNPKEEFTPLSNFI